MRDMAGRLVVAAALMIALASVPANGQGGWACVKDGEGNPAIEKYIAKGDALIDDDSDFVKQTMPGIDPHSTDRAMKILEDNERDILAVMTGNMAAQAGTYTGPLNKPWMTSVFINKVTGEARFIFAGFDVAEKDYVATGRCTRFN
jgi:hypothetical protein